MITKRMLLCTAAGLLSAPLATANAADLPSRKAAPVAYVKICDAYGAGYFYIPGTDTCLKVGGRVRFEYAYTNAKSAVVVRTPSTFGAPEVVARVIVSVLALPTIV